MTFRWGLIGVSMIAPECVVGADPVAGEISSKTPNIETGRRALK